MMKRLQAKTQRTGFVVVVVLGVIIMLTVLLFGFNHKSRANLRAVDDLRRSGQVLNCARAGLNIAIAAIKDTPDIHEDKTLSALLSGENNFPVGDGDCSVMVAEENGKLNLNLLKDENGRLNRTRIDQLLTLVDLLNRRCAGHAHIGYGLVPSIIDWTDTDEQVTCLPFIQRGSFGAESDYYTGLAPPYKCKNKPLETVDEMLLIKGMTPQIFDRISEYVTVCGDGKVNINCASETIIRSLSEKVDAALAEMIVARRRIKAFDTIAELRDVPGMTDSIYNAIRATATVRPADRYYRVTSWGRVGHLQRTVDAILRRDVDAKTIKVILYKEI